MSQLVHSVARVRALEDTLLSLSHLERMINASSFSESYSVLDDLGYAPMMSVHRGDDSYDQVLEEGLSHSRNLVVSFQDPFISSLLLLPFDLHNLKVLIKASRKGISFDEVEDLIYHFGFYPLETLISFVTSSSHLPFLNTAIESALSVSSLEEAEFIIEDAFVSYYSQLLPSRKDSFLSLYLKIFIDIFNIKRFIRLGSSASFLSGGNFLSSSFEAEEREVFDRISDSVLFGEYFSLAREKYEEKGTYSSLEDALDASLVAFLKKQAMGQISGYAPIFSFFIRKERNSRLIRNVLIAHKSGLSSDAIRSGFSYLTV